MLLHSVKCKRKFTEIFLQVVSLGVSEEEPLLHINNRPDQVNMNGDINRSSLGSNDAQAGVRAIEAINQTWTKRSLIVAYIG